MRFAAKGEKPEWQVVYDELLADADFGQVITYQQLDEVLGRPFRGRRGPIYRATRHLGALRHRWLEAVPNVGYRVIGADEHTRAAVRHRGKGAQQIKLGGLVLQATELSVLSPQGLTAWDQQTRINASLAAAFMAHEQRLLRVEAALQRHEERLETVELLGGTLRG